MDAEHLFGLGLVAGAAAGRIAVELRKAHRDRLALKDAPPEKRKDILSGLAAVAESERRYLLGRHRTIGPTDGSDSDEG